MRIFPSASSTCQEKTGFSIQYPRGAVRWLTLQFVILICFSSHMYANGYRVVLENLRKYL